MTVDDFLQKLSKVKTSANGWKALCPSHSDENRSLSIAEKDGKILLKCFAGCVTNSIVSALGLEMQDLFEATFPNGNGIYVQPLKQTRTLVAAYEYTDEHGQILYENVRYSDKTFLQRRPDGNGGYSWNLKGVNPVPYRLPELIQAAKTDGNTFQEIWLCEGEKDADSVRSLGFAASSFKKWQSGFNQYVKTAHIVLFQDHDTPGVKQAADAANILSGNVLSVKVIDLFEGEPLPTKNGKDITDYIDACRLDGKTNDEIKESLCLIVEGADKWQASNSWDTDFEETELKPFPVPSAKCFHGLAGEFVRMIESHTEGDPMGLLIQFLTYFGNLIGRSAFYQVEADKHFTNLFCVLVGDTASGRKGTSFGRVKEIFKAQDAAHESDCIVSGLASGEGLLYHVRDAVWEKKTDKKTKQIEDVLTDAGITDKRLLIVEGEFSQVLRVQGREGNTLSAFLRNLWDTGTARNLTKNSPLRTTDAHVSIIGHVTTQELLNCLSQVDAANGYANRFLWFAVRRSKFLPFGSAGVDASALSDFQNRLAQRITFAKAARQMHFTPDAKDLFASVYQTLETSRFGFLAKITQRASAYVCRLSCLFALLDGKDEIDCEHLEAGLAVWQYAEDSARYIFGGQLGDKNAQTILNALKNSENGLSRTEIRDLFDRNIETEKLNIGLRYLYDNGLARYETQQTKGKAKEVWFPNNVFNVIDVLGNPLSDTSDVKNVNNVSQNNLS